MKNTSEHIRFTRLVDLVEGRLSTGEQHDIREHLVACAVCADQVAWLERVIGLMRSDASEQPPERVLAAAKRLFRLPMLATRQQLMASLQFDSARTPVAQGRRAGTQSDRQLLFAASNYLLDLRIAQQGDLWVVSGQLLGTDNGQQVELNGPAGTTQARLNEMSEFVLPPSPPGTYTIKLQLAELDITIPGLEIGG